MPARCPAMFPWNTSFGLCKRCIASMFERFLLLAGGSNDLAPVEGPRGTMEVLYILNALKECLPLMSMKSTNIILKYCITLLAMRQSIVTQSIMGILQALWCSPTSEVAPQVLLDLLCSLASTIGDKEKSADGMASTARLLHVSTKKVYDLNRKMCIVKLPIMFRSLGDILASEHEEATYAATEALKGLLCSCVDEKLVQQGVEQINRNPDREIRKSAQTIIEKICATIEGFLGYRYNAVWDISFQVLSTAFDQLGNNSSHLMAGTIRSLADMQKLPDDDFPYRNQVNKKTRNRAYEMLVQIGHACGDEEQGGKKENLQQFFNMIAGGLAGESPYMISAAVKGIARLAYEFSDLLGAAYNLLPSSYLLLQRKNREIVKANLGLMKVLVAKSKADGLQMHLRGMVEGLLKWQDDTKNHFKAKVKLILEMLVKKCGLDAVKSVMPEEHSKLLTNIRKANERKERKSKSEEDQESIHSRSSVSRQSKWNHSRIFSEFGEEDEDNESEEHQARDVKSIGRTKAWSRSVRIRQALPDDAMEQLGAAAADPLDLLDRWKTRSALHSSGSHKRKPEVEEEPEIDPEGRLIVREGRTKPKKGKIDDARSQTGSTRSLNHKKRRKTTDSGWAYTGSEYTSKKAGGDLKKKDKLDPYAYWPLDRKLLNRRAEHKASARKGMSAVMRFAKRFEGKSASGALSLKGVKKINKTKKKKGSKKSR